MLRPMTDSIDPAARGLFAIYREGEVNRCPGCGRTHWIIGRTTAECGFCATALPLEATHSREGAAPEITRRGNGGGRVQ